MADRQGFEPWRRSPAYTLSRRAPSTTRPPDGKILYLYSYLSNSCDTILELYCYSVNWQKL